MQIFGEQGDINEFICIHVHDEIKSWNTSLQQLTHNCWLIYVDLIAHISTLFFHFSSMIIRDLTLRSAASFGSFHLIRLLYDEYIFYLVEHRVAAATQQTPIAVMGEVRVLHETNITFIRLLNTVLHSNSERVYILELSKHC